MKTKDSGVSPYTLLNKWLYDGSETTDIPKELTENKYVISQNILLYHFLHSKYIVYISEIFNNYNLYLMDRVDVFKFLKQCILVTGYRPKFYAKNEIEKSKVINFLKEKYPFLKKEEIMFLRDNIDNSDFKDVFYENIGIRNPKKEKTKKADLEEFKAELNYSRLSSKEFLKNFK